MRRVQHQRRGGGQQLVAGLEEIIIIIESGVRMVVCWDFRSQLVLSCESVMHRQASVTVLLGTSSSNGAEVLSQRQQTTKSYLDEVPFTCE